MKRALMVVATAACLVSPVFAQPNQPAGGARTLLPFYPAYERPLGKDFWMRTYRLTPREYLRLRHAGFEREEVFLIANAARATGLGTQPFVDAVHRGLRGRGIADQFADLTPFPVRKFSLLYVMKEWRTQEWADAVHEDVFNEERLNVWY